MFADVCHVYTIGITIKLSVNLNLHTARRPTPEVHGERVKTVEPSLRLRFSALDTKEEQNKNFSLQVLLQGCFFCCKKYKIVHPMI